MSKLLEQPPFDVHQPMQGQIRQWVRKLVESGELAEQERLPSTQALAKHWNVDLRTVHLALKPLVKEGLLSRTPRVGTIVRPREKKLERVAIYMLAEHVAGGVDSMPHALLLQLESELRRQDIEPDIWVDSRPMDLRGLRWPELEQAAVERRFQALIIPQVSWPLYEWVSKLPVALSVYTSANLPHRVTTEVRSYAHLSMRCLREQGCQSVGMLSSWREVRNCVGDDPWCNTVHDLYRCYHEEAERAGMHALAQWIQIMPGSEALQPSLAFEKFGYLAFCRLWSQPQRPDGLIITDNVMAQGVVKAILKLRANVPQQIKLVSLKLANVEMFAPLPMSFYVLDDAKVARALIEQIHRQFQGQPCRKLSISLEPDVSHNVWPLDDEMAKEELLLAQGK
ncbi:MAG: substrate-binding domain-containing protein [Phycisphaeraceae bacterium]|nr:substrate-binding domain-containing protein [Phycisphaeraceae bacterium]